MNNTTKLLLASLIMAGTAAQAVHGGIGGIEGIPLPFNITNAYGKALHVRILNLQGQTVVGPILIPGGDNYSSPYIPQVVSAHYPDIENSECGLVLKPDELKDKKVYLRVRLIRGKVAFMSLKGVENNISTKSIREAKKAYKDWKEEREKAMTVEGATVEAVITTTPAASCSMCRK